MEQVYFNRYRDEYYNNLRKSSCVPECIEELCGGWTQETYKQYLNKVLKKNTAPLPLWFDSPKEMVWLSSKHEALQATFNLLNTRKLNRIDSCEMFSVILFLAQGDFQTVIQNIPVIFGFRQTPPSTITRDEFFYFLDALFRGMSKILIPENHQAPIYVNRRLHVDNIRTFVETIFSNKADTPMTGEDLFNSIPRCTELHELLVYVHKNLQQSLANARKEQIDKMYRRKEVNTVLRLLIKQVEQRFDSSEVRNKSASNAYAGSTTLLGGQSAWQ